MTPLPVGFTVRLTRSLTVARKRDLLVGGSPLTVMRLATPAREAFDGDRVTVTDAASQHLARRLLSTNLAHPDLPESKAPPPRELTVVVPVRDRPSQLERALAQLDSLKCIVVDDASLDPEAVEAVCLEYGARYVPLDHNLGPAGARNVGLGLVTTPFVAFVDSDVQIAAKNLVQLTRQFVDPDVVLVGPRVVGQPARSSAEAAWFERYDAIASSLTLGTTPSKVCPGAAVAWLPSACVVARTEALGAGFDPTMRVGEDVDLVWRLVAAGHGVRYDPQVTAFHDTRPTMRGWLGRKFIYGTGGAGLADRHGGSVAPAILAPTTAIAAVGLLMRKRWGVALAALALARTTGQVRSTLPTTPGRDVVAINIATRGLGWAVRQEAALAVRHWWPLAALLACFSRRMRRLLLSAVVVDSAVAFSQTHSHLGPGTFPLVLAGRRLDDLAYGAGLWFGAIRGRTVRPLLPRRRAQDPGAGQHLNARQARA